MQGACSRGTVEFWAISRNLLSYSILRCLGCSQSCERLVLIIIVLRDPSGRIYVRCIRTQPPDAVTKEPETLRFQSHGHWIWAPVAGKTVYSWCLSIQSLLQKPGIYYPFWVYWTSSWTSHIMAIWLLPLPFHISLIWLSIALLDTSNFLLVLSSKLLNKRATRDWISQVSTYLGKERNSESTSVRHFLTRLLLMISVDRKTER